MKIFDHTNPMHIKILKEELAKIKHIIQEHIQTEDSDANNNGYPDETESLTKDARVYFRGIVKMLRNEEQQFSNVPEVLNFLRNKLKAESAELDVITRALYIYLLRNSVRTAMDLNIEVQNMLKSKTAVRDTDDSSFNAWMQDLRNQGINVGD
jgi:hypothetical protein